MTSADLFEETYIALTTNKVRTGLTMLGIVIGIGSVIAMIAIGTGAQESIESRIQSIGSNLITVYPGAQKGVGTQVRSERGSAQTLTLEDSDAIADNINNIQAVFPELSSRQQVTAKGTNTNSSITGTTVEYPVVRNVNIKDGSWFTEKHISSKSKVAVIGPTVKNDLFGEDGVAIGNIIRINGIQFTVIGVTESKGGSGFGNQDTIVFVPITTLQQFITGGTYVSNISVQAKDTESMTQVQNDITSLLLERHEISDSTSADFSIFNQEDLTEAASSVTETFTVLLAAVAGISLVVGGIGIMNMMLTTVTERTREIGLRKAVGAKRKDINIQFLIEATMLTLVGGCIGVLLGWLGSTIIEYLNVTQTSVSISSVVLAFSISAVIGILFGYYPAQKASKLHPIDALRYE